MKFKRLIPFAIILLIVGIFFEVLSFYIDSKPGSEIFVSHGTVDLSSWEQSSQGDIYSLRGDWEFYWKRLITYHDLQEGAKPDLIAPVPKVWNRYQIKGKQLPAFGFGTYRLRVTGAQPGKPLSLMVPTFSTAYRLFIDEKLLACNGIVSTDQNGGEPEYSPNMVHFTPSSDSFNIIIQGSNYTYARGGMWGILYLGTPGRIDTIEKEILCRDFFLIGSFVVMMFIYSSIFYFRRKEKSHLFFAVLCLIAFVRTILHGSYLIRILFPFFGFSTIIRMDYMTLYWFPAVLGLLLRELFPEEIHQKALYGITGYAAFITVLTLLAPISFFTRLIYLAEGMILLIAGYLIVRMCLSVIRKRLHAALVLTGCLILLVCCVYDALFQNNMLPFCFFEFTPVGFFVMLMGQAHVLAESFAETICKKEETLSRLQASLERERKSELKFLKSQIRPHFIHNALNTILSVSRRNVPHSQELLVEFSNYLRGCFDFKDLEDAIPIEKELEFVRSYITLEQARFGDRLRVQYNIDDNHLRVPPLILQPLVENAVVHGIRPKPDGGTILVYVKCCGDIVKVGVMDDGEGIAPERIGKLVAGEETGRSVGIFNITQRLNKLYHISLCIQNRESGGLNVYMELPRNGGVINDKSNAG